MKEMSPYAPDRWIRVLNRHFPNLWTGLRKAYQQPSMLGDREAIAEYLSGTPDWCIMPVMVPPLYLSRHYDSNVLQLRLQEAMSIATMYTWRAGKGVYRFEKELYDALVGQPLQGDLPVNSLFHLPEWGVYIETPGLAFEGVPLDGFIAHLDFNLYSRGIDLQLALFPDHAYARSRKGLWTEQIRHLPRITDPFAYSIATGVDFEYCPDQPRMLAIPLTMGPDDSISNCTLEAALRRVDDVDNLFRTEGPSYNATRESMQRCMSSMMQLLLYIMIGIIAFVFGITISNTISKEAPVIGTLRAMGFTKSELVRHYMAMPLLVTLVSAVIGNILGYTALKNVCADMYYNSYSLPKYVTIWNADAFVQTTAVPILIMALITWGVLRWSLGLTPLQFLRRDLRRRKSRKAFPLSPGIPFMDRFRIRVIAQNIPNYLILLFGIFFANILLIFGLALPVALDHYKQVIAENLLAERQYILQIPLEAVDEDHKLRGALKMMEFARGVETENETAEKFSAYNLRTPADGPYHSEDVMIYGMKSDSLYVKGIPESDPGAAEAAKTAASTTGSSGTAANTSKSTAAGAQSTADAAGAFPKVLISSAYSDKYDVFPGDRIVLQEKYGEDRYTFEVAGVYDYQASICVFMEQKTMNQCFDLGKDYFSGYMSQTPITDIDDKYIASEIDFESLTKVCRQLTISMGSMMYLVDFFAVVIFLVLIYILSKIIIEKNAQSISMAKILGYTGGEIGQLYIRSTTVVYLISFAATIPGVSKLIRYLMKVMIRMEMTGWIDLYVDRKVYMQMMALGAASYAVIAVLEYRKINKVPMDEALKNAE